MPPPHPYARPYLAGGGGNRVTWSGYRPLPRLDLAWEGGGHLVRLPLLDRTWTGCTLLLPPPPDRTWAGCTLPPPPNRITDTGENITFPCATHVVGNNDSAFGLCCQMRYIKLSSTRSFLCMEVGINFSGK